MSLVGQTIYTRHQQHARYPTAKNHMHLKLPPIEVPDAQPFANDKLQRQQSADLLCRFLSTVPTPYVLAIDAEWGQGKTTFLRMWERFLKNEGFPVHYFNAWEADYEPDPLIALMAEIRSFASVRAKTQNPTEAKTIKKHAKAIGRVGIRITQYALPKLIKAGTAGIIDAEELSELFGKEASEITEKVAEGALNEYEKQKQSLSDFKSELQNLASSLAGEQRKPLVILVDELDRCRPTYAVELIERIKHLFSVPGVVFVLALDRHQLSATVQAVYGDRFDGSGYLKRHFDFEYAFPTPDLANYCNFVYQSLGFDTLVDSRHLDINIKSPFLAFVRLTARALNASLRDIAHVMSRMYVAFALGKPGFSPDPRMLTVLAFTRHLDSDLYKNILEGKVTSEVLIDRFRGVLGIDASLQDNEVPILHGYLYVLVESSTALRARANEVTTKTDKSSPNLVRYNDTLIRVLAYHADEGHLRGQDSIRYTRGRLELSEQFRF